MKNLKNNIWLVLGCVFLSTLVCHITSAQTNSKRSAARPARIVNCRADETDCFIRAANACRRATVTTTKSFAEKMLNPQVPHPDFVEVSYYEIRGLENGKCIFYGKVQKADVKFSDEYIRYVMEENGETREQAQQGLMEVRKAVQQTMGNDSTCSFQTEKLVAMLSGWWQKGSGVKYSTKDFEGAECRGKLYNFSLPNQTITQ